MFNNAYLKDLNTTVFDIETTGLFHSRDCIINAGFCSSMGDVWQNFSEDPADEKRVVSEALERILQADAVITYNGDTFDLPFLLRRAQKYGLCERLPLLWSVDLYRWLKKYWPAAVSMKSMSQKSVEEAMGLADRRDDEIPGGDCIPLYNYYLQTKDTKAKDTILLHNADDVRQLARITGLGYGVVRRVVAKHGGKDAAANGGKPQKQSHGKPRQTTFVPTKTAAPPATLPRPAPKR